MANQDFDTAEAWVVTCPGTGAPHPATVPKEPKGTHLICPRCNLSMPYSAWLERVQLRDAIREPRSPMGWDCSCGYRNSAGMPPKGEVVFCARCGKAWPPV